MFKTPLMIEQHFHGAFGIDFNTVADPRLIVELSEKLHKIGIGAFFPTLVTDSVENIKRQIKIIKEAAQKCPAILGIHLEGIFINSAKKGIHNPAHFLKLTPENYKLLEDDFIKIVTLAPELDEGLIDYLLSCKVKIQAGHCIGGNMSKVSGATHTFNAMSEITHRGESTALSALINDNVYAEIIADGIHVSDDALTLFFKSKPANKVILISDALPITYSDMRKTTFAGSQIFYDGVKATATDGTLAGSTTMLDKIVKRLIIKNMFNPKFIENTYEYHGLEPQGEILWDNDGNIIQIS